MSAAPSRHSPQRELHLHGPRPPPLSLSKQSRKIKKQKAAPPPPPPQAKSHHHHPPPPPVIIYTVSPKKIHVEPEEFMSLVQRLTGSGSSSSTLIDTSSPPPPPPPPSSSGGGVFPAASYANAEPLEWRETQFFDGGVEMQQNRNLLWNATDVSNNLHGNVNNLMMNMNMNMPSASNVDVFGYFYDI